LLLLPVAACGRGNVTERQTAEAIPTAKVLLQYGLAFDEPETNQQGRLWLFKGPTECPKDRPQPCGAMLKQGPPEYASVQRDGRHGLATVTGQGLECQVPPALQQLHELTAPQKLAVLTAPSSIAGHASWWHWLPGAGVLFRIDASNGPGGLEWRCARL
jgi:hypothetical protein